MNDREYVKFEIGNINFEFNGLADKVFFDNIQPYITKFDKPDFKIEFFKVDERINYPTGKKLTDRINGDWYVGENGKYELVYTDHKINEIIIHITCDISLSNATIELLDVEKMYGIDASCLLFNTMEMLLHFVFPHYNGFVVHASSIAYKGTGLAFSAESGTGKSTHTALWLKNCPDDTVMLNDDKPIFRYFENDGWYIYGTPWAGTTGLNTNLKVPLKALVFLERSKTNSIRRLASAEVISRFFEAVISPMSDEITDKILELLGLLIEKSNVCLLKCNMENEAMETVKKFLYE